MVLTWRDAANKDRGFRVSHCPRTSRHQFANVGRPCKRPMCKDITVNRSCLTRTEHTEMLSTPRGYTWTGTRGLGFIVDRCKKKHPNGRRRRARPSDAIACCGRNATIMWQNFAKGFLEIANDNLAPVTKMILTRILTSKTKFSSDPKCCNYTNAQTELCRFLRNITPKCKSNKWKRGFFRTLSSLIFNYIVHVHCSGRLSKKTKLTRDILKKINNITIDDVLLNSPKNFSQGVQIFIANMLSPWLEKSITDICNATNNSNSHNKSKQMNDFLQHKLNLDSNGKYKPKNKKPFKSKLSIGKPNIGNTKQKVGSNGNIGSVGENIKNKHLKVKQLLTSKYKIKINKRPTNHIKITRFKTIGKSKINSLLVKTPNKFNRKIRICERRKMSMIKSSIDEKTKMFMKKKSYKNGKKIKTKSTVNIENENSSFERMNNINKMTSDTKFKISNGNKGLKMKLMSKLLKKSKLKIRGKNNKFASSKTTFQSSKTKYDKSNKKYNDKMNNINNNNNNDFDGTKTGKNSKNKINKRKQSLATRDINRSTKDGEDNEKELRKQNRLNDGETTNKNRRPGNNNNNRSSDEDELKKRNRLNDGGIKNKNRRPGDKNDNQSSDEDELRKQNRLNDGETTNKNRRPGNNNNNRSSDEDELKKRNLLDNGTTINNRRPNDKNDNGLWEKNELTNRNLDDDAMTNKNRGPNDYNKNGIDDKNNINGVNNVVDGNDDPNNTAGGKANRRLKINKDTKNENALLTDGIEKRDGLTTNENEDKIKNNHFNLMKTFGADSNEKTNFAKTGQQRNQPPNGEINRSTKKHNEDNENLLNEEELINNILYDQNDRATNSNNCAELLANDSHGLNNTNEDELDCIIKNEMNRFLNKLEAYCTETVADRETCYGTDDQLQCKDEGNCFIRFANNTKRWFRGFQMFDTKNAAAKQQTKELNKNPGIFYQIRKKDGSDYSVKKIILPMSPNAN